MSTLIETITATEDSIIVYLPEDLQYEIDRAKDAENQLNLRLLALENLTSEFSLLGDVHTRITEVNTNSINRDREFVFAIGSKAPTESPSFYGTVSGITKDMVGLPNVDDTSDMDKPVSIAQNAAIQNALYNTTPKTHIGSVGNAVHGEATQLYSGFMSIRDKIKLDAITGTNTGDQVNIIGNSETTTKLKTPITIRSIGDVTWEISNFDASSNVTFDSSLKNTNVISGLYGSETHMPVFNINAKGIIESVTKTVELKPSWSNISEKPTTISGYGITDDLKLDSNPPLNLDTEAKTGISNLASRSDHVHKLPSTDDIGAQPRNLTLDKIADLSNNSGFIRFSYGNISVDNSTYLTSQGYDFGKIKITTDDTGFSWDYTNNISIESDDISDTVILVATKIGDTYGINLKLDPNNDAIGIEHSKTSTLVGKYGTSGISSITVDDMGHITEILTDDYTKTRNKNISLSFNNGQTEDLDLYTYNGDNTKTISISSGNNVLISTTQSGITIASENNKVDVSENTEDTLKYVSFVNTKSGNQSALSSDKLKFNPSTGDISISGNVNIPVDKGIVVESDYIKFNSQNSSWNFSNSVNLNDTKSFLINNKIVLSQDGLGNDIVKSKLTSLGLTESGFVISNENGNISVDKTKYVDSSTLTLDLATSINASTSNKIELTNLDESTAATNGVLVVHGGVGIGKTTNINGNLYLGSGSARNRQHEFVYAPLYNEQIGDTQVSKVILSQTSTDDTQIDLTIDNMQPSASNQIKVEDNQTVVISAIVCASQSASEDDVVKIWKVKCSIKNTNSSLRMIGQPIYEYIANDIGSETWKLDFRINNVLNVISVSFTGEQNKTIRCVANLELTEIIHN